MMTEVFKEAKRLHNMGADVLWLHPKSKRPIESKWTTRPRHVWGALEQRYFDKVNVGIVLGRASKIGGHYLACIDVDVKNPAYRETAETALAELIEDREFPEVQSGGGNGSRHLYCVTAAPFDMITYRKEDGWEICIYSTGRQMVLPPSVHPTGSLYQWKKQLSKPTDLPLMDFSSFDNVKPVAGATVGSDKPRKFKRLESFKVEEVELEWLPIPDDVRAAIVSGTGVTDRSNYLPKAVRVLRLVGLSRNEILSVLTDPKNFLGASSYDHILDPSKTRRDQAAAWVYKYTMGKIEDKENAAPSIFASVPIVASRELTPDEMEENEKEFEDPFAGGFYNRGPKGGLTPRYDLLLKFLNLQTPFKTMSDMKGVYRFNGTHYEYITPIHIKAFAEDHFNPKPEEKVRVEFLNKVMANNVTDRTFFTNGIEGKINFKNGVLNLTDDSWSRELMPHSPEYGFRGMLPYDFDPDAECPVFNKWIHDLMLGDEKLIAILQEFMGYIVRGGEYKYHKALWLGGVGRNGKSTCVDLLKALIGSGNYSTISIKSLVGDKFVGADLDGKIANFSEETSPQELADSGPFKNLTGDGDISAQKKYGDPFHFRNRAKLIMTYNEIPDLKDLSEGMLSRPLIIPFKKKIEEKDQDRKIKSKLFAELSGIFNFALKGWERLEKQNGFTKSSASELALTKIKEESCNVFQWIENYVKLLEPKVSQRIFNPQELYAAYRNHERFTYSYMKFTRRLKKHPEIQKRCRDGRDTTEYFDIEIRG